MRKPKHRIHSHALGLTKRTMKKYAITAMLGLWVLMCVVYLFSDTCHGRWHTQLLCQEFELGNIGGDLCHNLCREKTVYLSSCERDGHGNLIFAVNSTVAVKTRDRFSTREPSTRSFLQVYQKPETGTSMEQFRHMVTEHLQHQLGDSHHGKLVQQLLNIADVNKDDKVSLAEAKTLWALLKQNDFLMMQIFKGNSHVPQLEKFCGETYMMKHLPIYKAIYDKPKTGFWALVFPSLYTWGFPAWYSRGKVAVGLLEFTLDAYQHQNHGSFYLCNLNESNVGYTSKHDAVLQDLTMVIPKNTMQSYLHNVQCASDSNCRFTEHCTAVCDRTNKQCTGDLVQPNLSLVCSILKPYVLPDIPKPIRPDFLNLIYRCSNLKTTSPNFEVQHSLILNDLKSLLWRQISTDV